MRRPPQIDVSENLMKSIPQWKHNIHSFFTEDALDLNLDHPIAESYRLLLQLETRGEKDTWRTRFLKVVFHRLLKKTSGGHYVRSADVTRASTIIEKSGIVSDHSEHIGTRFIAWGKTGQRLDLLCEDLLDAKDRCDDGRNKEEHLGFLFCLPEYVTDN